MIIATTNASVACPEGKDELASATVDELLLKLRMVVVLEICI